MRARVLIFLSLLLSACIAPAALGQTVALAAPTAAEPALDKTVELFAAQEANGLGRVEVSVGQLDSRIRLAPCARMEPFLPPGMRLWGRGYIGMRCVEGAHWSVMVPVTVRIYGKALVAAQPLTAGLPVGENDVREEEIELTRETTPPITDRSLLAGKTLARGLMPGQPLRIEYLRVPPTVAAGDPVKIELVGTGFSVAASGQALSPGGEGQTVRVRTEAGRMLSGVIRHGRTVEVRL